MFNLLSTILAIGAFYLFLNSAAVQERADCYLNIQPACAALEGNY